MYSKNKTLVTNFIEEIWNQNQFENLENYLASTFIDHSLPVNLPANKIGLQQWIEGTSKSFDHHTSITDLVCEADKVMLKFKMNIKHIGVWRAIEPTHAEIHTVGYRYFKIADDKIVEHWALLDGNSIENQLKHASEGCKIQE